MKNRLFSGTYLEYFCAECGYNTMIKITNTNEENGRKIMKQRIEEHKIKCPKTKDVFVGRIV